MQIALRWSKSLLLVSVLLTVAACGKSGNIVTQDDSAEYRSAQSLPPLKKPEGSDVLIESASSADTPAQAQTPVAAEPTAPAPAAVQITASEVDAGDNQAELEINAPFDQAWRFVRRNIGRSDLTVHTRNRAAGRFTIGCSSLEGDAPQKVTKKGGWSIFKRSKETGVHCALQLLAAKDITRVQVLGRDGEPVSAESAREIYSRLLNN